MVGGHTGFRIQLADRIRADTAARLNTDASRRLALQFGEKLCSFYRTVLLTGGKNGVHTKQYRLLKRFFGIAADIKRAVQRHGHAVGCLHQLFHCRHIHRSILFQHTDHNALCTKFAVHRDFLADFF